MNQLKKYLQTDVKPLTTACCIIESEQLGSKFQSTTKLLKEFKVHVCGHEKTPIPGSKCFKSISKKSRYLVATQDRDLQDWIRTQAGIPLIYLHQVAPILDPPSESTMKKIKKGTEKVMEVSKVQENRLNFYKRKEGLLVEVTKDGEIQKKRKVKGGPNPLSCKKRKKNKDGKNRESLGSGKVEKPRKRIKIPKHVKELGLSKNKTTS